MNSREAKRAASLHLNQWICVTGQYEKVLLRLGRDLYRAHKKGQLDDQDACEYCQILTGIFEQAKSVREDLQLDLQFAVNKHATGDAHLGQAKKKMGKFVSQRFLDAWDQLNLPKYKESASGHIQQLARRALTKYDRGDALIDREHHRKLCRLALALEEDCQACWEKLVALREENKSSKGSLSLSTITIQLAVGVGKFVRKSQYGQKLAKALNYSETVEKTKLLARFIGRPEELALREHLGFASA